MPRRTTNPAVRVIVAIFVAISLLTGIILYKNGQWPFDHAKDDRATVRQSHAVGSQGGTFAFPGGISITVPPDAAADDSTLQVSPVRGLPATVQAPLSGVNKATVVFDVLLSHHDQHGIQPRKPLDITVPLKGSTLPSGTTPSEALMYTPGTKGGYQLVQQSLKGDVLHGTLTHLSPKYITYVDEDKFARRFGIDGMSITRPRDCKSEVTASDTGKVKFGSGNKGWANTDKGSPINACLTAGSDGNPQIGIVNKRYYVLSVAVSSGVSVETSRGDMDEELTKLFAQKVFPNKKIAAFLGRDGRLVATTPAGSLPARVQFKADPNTFLSESGLFALKFTAGLLTGKSGSELTRTVNALFDTADVVDCLQTTLDVSTGKAFDFGFDDALKLVTSKCMSTIGEALGMPSSPWDLFGRWFNTIGDGLSGGLQTVRTAYEGIRMQTIDGSPPVTVRVESTLNLSRFVGEWYVHGSNMTVNADGTGVQQWNDGPCEDDDAVFDEHGMCTGHSTLKITPLENGFKVVRTSVWYTDKNGDRHTPQTVREYGEFRPVGQSTTFSRVSDTAIKTPSDGGDGFGNPYMCRSGAPEADEGICGL